MLTATVSTAKTKPASVKLAARSGGDASGLRPVVILGGEANALSVARDLGRMGVKVFAIVADDSALHASRFCTCLHVPIHGSTEESWTRYLLGSESDHIKGGVLLACNDMAIGVVAKRRADLQSRFLLDDSNTEAALAMLDKLTTYEHARAAGVTTPSFWTPKSRQDVLSLRDELKYPLLVKPRLSHVFEEHFGRKHVTVSSFEELLAAYDVADDAGMQMLLVEQIPGGDDQLCSYYTYLDEHAQPLFHFTKRVIRRYPVGMGAGCYHITDWIPEIVEPSLKLFTHVGLRGLCNIEFKRDPRDGQYKLIEINARFTAANSLVAKSGFSIAQLVYRRLVGLPPIKLEHYKSGVRLLDPIRDFCSYLQLRRTGELSFWGWLSSVMHRQTFGYFALSDPGPTFARALRPVKRLLTRFRKASPAQPSTFAQSLAECHRA